VLKLVDLETVFPGPAHLCIALEYVEGRTLSDVLSDLLVAANEKLFFGSEPLSRSQRAPYPDVCRAG